LTPQGLTSRCRKFFFSPSPLFGMGCVETGYRRKPKDLVCGAQLHQIFPARTKLSSRTGFDSPRSHFSLICDRFFFLARVLVPSCAVVKFGTPTNNCEVEKPEWLNSRDPNPNPTALYFMYCILVAIFLAAIKFIVGGGVRLIEDMVSRSKGIWCMVYHCF
jgi:hypothetical protein